MTGGASGLGCATVKRFAKNGSQVILCDIRESKGIEIAQQIGKNVQFIQADVSSPDDVKSLVNQIKETYGKLNAVVNCAGIANAYSIHNFNKDVPRNLKDFISVIQVNNPNSSYHYILFKKKNAFNERISFRRIYSECIM